MLDECRSFLSIGLPSLGYLSILSGQLQSNLLADGLEANGDLLGPHALAVGNLSLALLFDAQDLGPRLCLDFQLFSHELGLGLLRVTNHFLQRCKASVRRLLHFHVLIGEGFNGGPRLVSEFVQDLGVTSMPFGLLAGLAEYR